MDKNFRVRLIVGTVMFVVALVALYTFDGLPFKVLFGLFSLVAAIELFSFFKKGYSFENLILVIFELAFLFYGALFVSQIDTAHFWSIILGVPGYDIFAYVFGKAFGGKVFGKKRPFPKISKNKTWEGTILGLVMAIGMVAVLMAIRGAFATDWFYLLCGPLALCGDLFESFLKRRFKVKDSNEILIKNPLFAKLELLIGGAEGHGGYLDRVDSTAFAAAILLIISILI